MRTIAIDSSNLIYASSYSSEALEGNTIAGVFISKIIRIASKFNTNKLIFCFDSDTSIRRKRYKGYKANRKVSEADLALSAKRKEQTDKLKYLILRHLGFKNIFYYDGYEADDILAYLSTRIEDMLMLTNDSDLFQCLNDCTIVKSSLDLFTREDFIAKYKIDPAQWPMAKAIGGCYGDNIIGVEYVSDPKSPKSKALAFLRGELTKGEAYDRILASNDLIKRNLRVVKLPLGDKDFKIKIREDSISIEKIIRTLSMYRLGYLVDANPKKWNIFLKKE